VDSFDYFRNILASSLPHYRGIFYIILMTANNNLGKNLHSSYKPNPELLKPQ